MVSEQRSNEIRIVEVGFEALPVIADINRIVFEEDRIINRFDRPDLTMLLAYAGDDAAGFKIGYGLDRKVYYSAKGGVLRQYRRQGVANSLLTSLMGTAATKGYRKFCFDTFPNRHSGMTHLAIERGFVVLEVRYSDTYDDLRVRFSASLEIESGLNTM